MADGGIDFDELADDIAAIVRTVRHLNDEITTVNDRIERLYWKADPAGIFVSGPGMKITLAAEILGRLGDANRFDNLAGVRAYTGLVPSVDQSANAESHGSPTKAGDPGLRRALYLAAEHARRVDPTLAAKSAAKTGPSPPKSDAATANTDAPRNSNSGRAGAIRSRPTRPLQHPTRPPQPYSRQPRDPLDNP